MKRKNGFKRALACLLVVVMLLTTAPLAGIDSLFASKASAAYAVGDHIEYGNYPQSKVTDESTLALLDSLDKNWISYRYYSGTGTREDGKMEPSDYMFYAEIDTDGDGLRDYRAVRIDEYRPRDTGDTSSSSNSEQYNNGYITGNVYYFKCEPILWRILDPSDGLIMTEKIMDSQAYNNYIIFYASESKGREYYGDLELNDYANDYYNSSIRQWLNYDFYNTAFTSSQASNIRNDVILNNDCYNSSLTKYNAQASKDKIFLLSYEEVRTSSYGFNSSASVYDVARQAQGTDYAKSQGLYVEKYSSYSGNSWWWLRSASYYSPYARDVSNDASFGNYHAGVSASQGGIRPVCRLYNLKNDISKSSINNDIGSGAEGSCSTGHTPYSENNAVAPTCTKTGLTASIRCAVCNKLISKQKEILALNHNLVVDVEAKDATCTESGTTEGKHCTRCDYKIEAKEIPALNHNFVVDVEVKDATCTESGTTEGKHCTRCDYKIEAKEIAPFGHTDSNNDGKCDRCGAVIEGYNPSANCNHICHKKGILHFFYLIARFFWKLFGVKRTCSCGVSHY